MKKLDKQHVRFGGEEMCESGRSISVEDASTDVIRINVGLLNRYHRYRVEAPINRPYEEIFPAQGLTTAGQKNCVIESLLESPCGCTLTLNLFVGDNEVSETLRLGSQSKPVQIVVAASVLRPKMGTPVLKNGVHLIGKEELVSSDED